MRGLQHHLFLLSSLLTVCPLAVLLARGIPAQPASFTIELTGQLVVADGTGKSPVAPSPQDLQIVVIAANSPALCTLRPRSDMLCAAVVPSAVAHVRVEITGPAYKKLAVNVPRVSFNGNGVARLHLGKLELARANVPALQQVIAGSVGDKTVFQLIVHNGPQQPFTVQQILFAATRRGGDACFDPIAYALEVGQRTAVVSVGRVHRLSGTFSRVEGVRRLTMRLEGTVIGMDCNGEATLALLLPTGFVMPRDEYSSIEFSIPRQFAATKPGGVNQKILLTSFDSFEFKLAIAKPEGLQLSATIDNPEREH